MSWDLRPGSALTGANARVTPLTSSRDRGLPDASRTWAKPEPACAGCDAGSIRACLGREPGVSRA
jgi:hypothetical protein